MGGWGADREWWQQHGIVGGHGSHLADGATFFFGSKHDQMVRVLPQGI